MIDEAVIKQFIHDVGAESALRLADLFIAESEDNIQAIAEHLPEPTGDNVETLTRLAHSLKSTSKTYGLPKLGDIAADMEQAARADDFLTYANLYGELAALAPQHLVALRAAYEAG